MSGSRSFCWRVRLPRSFLLENLGVPLAVAVAPEPVLLLFSSALRGDKIGTLDNPVVSSPFSSSVDLEESTLGEILATGGGGGDSIFFDWKFRASDLPLDLKNEYDDRGAGSPIYGGSARRVEHHLPDCESVHGDQEEANRFCDDYQRRALNPPLDWHNERVVPREEASRSCDEVHRALWFLESGRDALPWLPWCRKLLSYGLQIACM